MTIATPYLLFLGDAADALAAKVAQGVKDWRPENAVGQFRLPGCNADMGVPDMTLEEGRAAGAKTLLIGVANRGGVISEAWLEVLRAALDAGYDIASGLHNHLNAIPELVEAAAKNGRKLHDVRIPSGDFPIGVGKVRSGKRILAVGTDCSCGKMYAMLAMERDMRARGMKADFRSTGQTGILITGSGVPLDAVVADFMAGAVEQITPDNDADHYDLIEGQGSLFHASFSGVTMALVHGGRPDYLVLCHEPTRTHMRGLPHYSLPSLKELEDLALQVARIVNPGVRVLGCAVNTAALPEDEAMAYLAETSRMMETPAVDPFRQGTDVLIDALDA